MLVRRLNELGIRPNRESQVIESSRNSLTENVLRRAAEIRDEWLKKPDSDHINSLMPSRSTSDETKNEQSITHNVEPPEELDDWSSPQEQPSDSNFQPHSVPFFEDSVTLDLDERVKRLLAVSPTGLKIAEIATTLGVSHDEVNQVIFGRLSRIVGQDAESRWKLRHGITTESTLTNRYVETPIGKR